MKETRYREEITFVLHGESDEPPRYENPKILLELRWHGDGDGLAP